MFRESEAETYLAASADVQAVRHRVIAVPSMQASGCPVSPERSR